MSLLEVIADELVHLAELASFLVEPGGEVLVQLRSGRLRKRVVGGIPDQDVMEAEAVLASNARLVRFDQPLPDERRQGRRHLQVGRQRLDERPDGRPLPR